MDFNDIVGHDKIIKSLQGTIKRNNVSHSYLLEGPKSIGKTMVAKAFAKTLLCDEKGTAPCNECKSCIKFDSNNHPDVYVYSSDGKTFKKEKIEELQRTINIKPYEGDKKIYILENIDTMTTFAQNSFLKTLEEPPKYATILMTVTNSHSLLPTIISRCQILKFTRIDSSMIMDRLINKYGIDDNRAKIITSFSNGIIGKAIDLSVSQEFNDIREELINTIEDTLKGDKSKIFSLSKFFEENKENIDDILDMILIWFRDILFVKELDHNKFIINRDKLDILNNQSNKLSKMKIHDIIETVKETKNNIASKVNFNLAIEIMLLKIQEG